MYTITVYSNLLALLPIIFATQPTQPVNINSSCSGWHSIINVLLSLALLQFFHHLWVLSITIFVEGPARLQYYIDKLWCLRTTADHNRDLRFSSTFNFCQKSGGPGQYNKYYCSVLTIWNEQRKNSTMRALGGPGCDEGLHEKADRGWSLNAAIVQVTLPSSDPLALAPCFAVPPAPPSSVSSSGVGAGSPGTLDPNRYGGSSAVTGVKES